MAHGVREYKCIADDEEVLLRVDRDAFRLTDRVAGRHQRQFGGLERNLGGVLLELGLRGERSLLLGASNTRVIRWLLIAARSTTQAKPTRGNACADSLDSRDESARGAGSMRR